MVKRDDDSERLRTAEKRDVTMVTWKIGGRPTGGKSNTIKDNRYSDSKQFSRFNGMPGNAVRSPPIYSSGCTPC